MSTPTDACGDIVVAIDGPSGSGKSTVARAVAEDLGAALPRHRRDVPRPHLVVPPRGGGRQRPKCGGRDDGDPPAGGRHRPRGTLVRVGGHDVTQAIRETRISSVVSAVATNLDVRASMRLRQRAIIAESAAERRLRGRGPRHHHGGGAGRRRAGPAHGERARLARRAREVHGSDDARALAATADQVHRRDAKDSTVVEFMQAAEGVDVVDSSDLMLDETVDAVLALVARRTGTTGGARSTPS